jgi:hypothetical protein
MSTIYMTAEDRAVAYERARQTARNVLHTAFFEENNEFRANGHRLPNDAELEVHFEAAMNSDNPIRAVQKLQDAYTAPGGGRFARPIVQKLNREDARRALGVNFSAEHIDNGLKIQEAIASAPQQASPPVPHYTADERAIGEHFLGGSYGCAGTMRHCGDFGRPMSLSEEEAMKKRRDLEFNNARLCGRIS